MSYVTNPPCSPSRCCIMTGMYAQRFGKSGMARGLPIPDDHPTMAEFMRDAGYVTGQIGKWDIGSATQGPHRRGFTQVARHAPGKHYNCRKEDGSTVYRTDLDGDYMVEFVERNKDKPFFLYFSPLAIHSPLKQTPRQYRDRVKGGKKTTYGGAIAAVDDAVGRLLAVLKKRKIEKNTLIMLTGDNGPNLREGGSPAPYRGGKFPGNTIYEGWVHTPTIVCWPGTVPAGKTYDGLMGTMDFYAAAAAVAGKPLPKRCDGRDPLPYLKGQKSGDVHEYLFWHNADPTDARHRNLYAVRWKNWRLVKRKDVWRLFDLEKDPRETKDVAKGHADIVRSMRKQYDAFVSTLPPLKPSKDYRPPRNTPRGWGWVMDGKDDKAKTPRRRARR
jgi:arylsulfatase A-like enzyme